MLRLGTTIDSALLLHAQELVHVGTWVYETETGAIQWSDELFRLFDLEPGSVDITFELFLSFEHPDDRARVSTLIATTARDRSSFDVRHRIVTAKGRERVHQSRGQVVCDEHGRVVRLVGACIDVTESALAEQALRASEERFRSLFEQSAVAMGVADEDGRTTRANASYAAFFGYSEEEIIGVSFLDLTHPDDVPRTREMMSSTRVEPSFTYEKRYVRRDGGVVWGRASVTRLRTSHGVPNGYMAIIEDITARKEATEALTQQRQLLATIMDHLPVMVSMFNSSGEMLYANAEWERTFGWTLAEARNIDVLTLSFPDDAEREAVRRQLATSDRQWYDLEPRRRDGQVITAAWACVALADGTTLSIGQDTSERKTMQQRLVQAAKMEALGQLAGGVAHDFNNILTVIMASSSFVAEVLGGNASALDDVREIKSACDRAAALTRQLLAFSRRQILTPEVMDLNDVVLHLGKTLKRLIGEHIVLAVLPNARAATIRADRHQLEQVVINLAVNARDALSDGGTITIETRNAATRGGGEPSLVELRVSDTGSGIDSAILDRIFDPFFTTKGAGQGTGLGLATVQGIVEQTGGSVTVESALGRGTTFTVVLPIACDAQVLAHSRNAESAVRGLETILLAEDEASVRAVIARMLTDIGYTVLEARHGADALSLFDVHGDAIDLLVTDVVMPELGGRELTRAIRQVREAMPVLYMSGYTDDELLRKGILEPGVELLRKPFTATELAASIGRLLASAKAA